MASFTGYKLMGVSAYSANPQWAAKLADWLTNEQNQTVRFEMNGQGPSNTKAADSDAVKASPSIQAVIAQSEFGNCSVSETVTGMQARNSGIRWQQEIQTT